MTKEEILKSKSVLIIAATDSEEKEQIRRIMKAMDEYAKQEGIKGFEGLKIEITASMLMLPPNDDYKKGWNDAMKKAIKLTENYIKNEGLFQA